MLLTKQHLVNTVDDRWKKQYYLNFSWDYYGDDKVEKYEELVNLGKNKNPEDVDKIIGNSSWTRLICNHCNKDVDAVFIFGIVEESLYVCEDCVSVAVEQFNKLKEVKMKEYIAKVSGDWRLVDSHELVSGRIEVPEGAEEYRANYKFYKNSGELFYCPYNGWSKSIMSEYKTLWQRSPTTLDSKNTSIQNKLKFIEKWLNGEKIQYILGVESDKIQSDKTQWHNFTEGAMQYIKRSDIKFREAPKYVTINGIEFKSVESLLKHVKNNFDLEDGG